MLSDFHVFDESPLQQHTHLMTPLPHSSLATSDFTQINFSYSQLLTTPLNDIHFLFHVHDSCSSSISSTHCDSPHLALDFEFSNKGSIFCYTINLRFLISRCGDVEPNPGPKLTIGTYNARGCNNYSKLKRIVNSVFKLANSDRFIFSLQETHVDSNKSYLINSLWRSGSIISPGLNNARGVITLYSNLFDSIIFQHANPNGRSSTIIGSFDDKIEMFVSIYAPNSGKNLEFYRSFFKTVKDLQSKHNVENTYILGDFNLVLKGGICNNRSTTKYEHNVSKEISLICDDLSLDTIKPHVPSFTWSRNGRSSTLDYIIAPKNIVNSKPRVKTIWGFDNSDHAAVLAIIDSNCERGPGMFRANTSFLDNKELLEAFQVECFRKFNLSSPLWDPHMKLEYYKVIIRTLLVEFSTRHKLKLNDSHENLSTELINLYELLYKSQSDPLFLSKYLLTPNDLYHDISILESLLDKVLEDKTKYLASNSRVKWLELGEKSNKYFLNLNKSFQNKSFFRSFLTGNGEVFNIEDKLNVAYDFYKNLYSKQNVLESSFFLNNIHLPKVDDVHLSITNPFTADELTSVLKKCGDTASGPDGIGYKVLKCIWNLYFPVLVESYEYGIKTGLLAPSHREAVICLLAKKNKDIRLIQNLRPISLSNCDIKVLTKALTKRFNYYLNKVINPHQVAYLPGRQIHDNLRSLDLIKQACTTQGSAGYLVSLDARKAFDSVDHQFIQAVIKKFGFNDNVVNIFKVLYNKIESKILINGFFTNSFPINQGVKQGDALSCSLFIMCMEIIMSKIENNSNISSIKFNNLTIPKVFGYADDIGIIVPQPSDISHAIADYESFSQVSGLFLNVDKTEILNLHNPEYGSEIIINTITGPSIIKTVKSLTICGKLFSLDLNLEYCTNVLSKIDKLEYALRSWAKRPLSIFGRNIIIKTFGLSQLIFMMQNTFFHEVDLLKAERICYNFLWNKKADKKHAYERISRVKLKLPVNKGGINSPDLESLDSALKIRQVIRSTDPSNNHIINLFQTVVLNFNPNSLLNISNCNPFIHKVTINLRKLGRSIINEICDASDLKLHKAYYDCISSESLKDLIRALNLGPIPLQIASNLHNRLGIKTVHEFINEHKFPSTEAFVNPVNLIVKLIGPLFSKLCERKNLNYDTTYRDSFILGTNRLVHTSKVTTKLLRLAILNLNLPSVEDDPKFRFYSKIIHPKEREIEFFLLHNAILTNSKLFEMKFRSSPDCDLCHTYQDHDHLFNDCSNAVLAFHTLSKYKDELSCPSIKSNILSLIKRHLFLNRDKVLHEATIMATIESRLSDLKRLADKKYSQNENAQIKRFALKV